MLERISQERNILKGGSDRVLYFHDDIDDISMNILKSFILEVNTIDDLIDSGKSYYADIEEDLAYDDNGDVIINEETGNPEKALIEKTLWGENYNRKDYPIVLHCTSYGGSLDDLFSLTDIMEKSKTPIHIHINGYACSAMTMLCLFADKSTSTKRTKWMIHNMTAGTRRDNLSIVKNDMRNLLNLEKEIRKVYEEKTKIPKKILNLIFKRSIDYDFTSEQALEWGMIDEIV